VVKINHSYLIQFTLVYCVASTIQAGFLLGENGQVGFVLAEKLGWNKDGTALTKNTIITVAGTSGLALGSMFGGKITQTGKSLKMFVVLNVASIFANSIKLILNF
jgi:hypothetical protein